MGHNSRLFLKEHREAKRMSAPSMAAQLGIQRQSLYRLEREPGRRMSVDKQIAYAAALGSRRN
jgi:DNA-binding XRE family transcriptional regulator